MLPLPALLLIAPTVSGFVRSAPKLPSVKTCLPLSLSHADPLTSTGTVASPDPPERWASHALLFSSLNDGVIPNEAARSFLRYSLTNALLRERITKNEDRLKSSVKFSPCNGPNMDALERLDLVDELHARGQAFSANDFDNNDQVNSWTNEVLNHLLSNSKCDINVRILYIPTAMYALNPQSSSTPGKQRQRARSDGKKRRTQLLKLLGELLSLENSLQPNLLATTLDLDDGSLKQPVGSEDTSLFPENDRAALSTWHPHLIYVEGGNTFWLQHCIEKGGPQDTAGGGYSALLKDAICTGSQIEAVFMGKSAGAIIAGDNVATATWKGWDDPSVGFFKDYSGLGLAGNRSFFPHMSDDWNDLVKEKMQSHSIKAIVCLREEDVYCIAGGKKLSFSAAGPKPPL